MTRAAGMPMESPAERLQAPTAFCVNADWATIGKKA